MEVIGRLVASAAAVTPVAAAAVRKSAAVVRDPLIWHFLGYPFEAAGMAAALFGCGAARWWIGAAASIRKEHRWSLDVPVSGMALATAAGMVISLSPSPLVSLMLGAGVGIIGEGIFKLAERQVMASGAFGGAAAPTVPPARSDDVQAIESAMRALHALPAPDEGKPNV